MHNAPARILSVEDDTAVRDSIAAWLEDSGYEVLQAEDGARGVEVFLAELPDLVLLDMGLPELSGMEVLRRIHAASPETPVVIVSANAHIADAIGAFKAGAWDYVTKPIVNFDVLEQTINNCLERKGLKEKIRLAEARYRDLVQNLPVLVFTLSEDLTLTFINDTCQAILGYAPEELTGRPGALTELVAPEDREHFIQTLTRSCASTGGFNIEFRLRHKNGYALRLQAKSIASGCEDPDEGPPTIQGIMTDVTERTFLEKLLVQREKLNTLGAMSHELAHEIRNPLMSLGGFAKRLAAKHPDMAEAEIILEQAQRLEQLMNRISAYVAPVPVKLEAVNLSAVLTYCLDRLTPFLLPQGQDIHLRLDLEMEETPSDPDLLAETFASVMSHLTGAMSPQGRLVIRTSQTPTQTSAEFDLADPGANLPQADPDTLLMPFESGEGTLDLALAYRNLKNLGGVLNVSPRPDGGAVITASLPREPIV